jgi:hypothetical protein
LVILFTSNHCPTAQLYEGRFKQIVADYSARGVAFVAINPNHPDAVRLDEMAWTDLDDTFEAMKIRAQDRGFTFPYLDDGETQAVSERFGAIATPHIFIFDQDRKLRFQGRIDDSEREALVKHRDAREALDAVLAGREPAVTQTKVFGCSIKWRDKAEDNHRWLAKVAKEPVTLSPVDPASIRRLRENTAGNKVVMVTAWSTSSEHAHSQLDELVKNNLRFRARDLESVTIAVEPDTARTALLERLQQHRASMRNLIFQADKSALGQALDPDWNGELPHTLLIAPGGKVLYRQTGAIDFLAMRRALLPALDTVAPWPANGGR